MASPDHPQHASLPKTNAGSAGYMAALLIGDVITFLVFAAIGRSSHSEAAGLNALPQVAYTAAPFLAGWLIVAPLVGAFRRDTTSQVVPGLLRATLAWLAAWPLGLVFRAFLLQRGIPPSFAVVVLITNTVLLSGWRAAFAWVAGRIADKR